MPGRDGTGPLGQGRLTGRGLGYCSDGYYRRRRLYRQRYVEQDNLYEQSETLEKKLDIISEQIKKLTSKLDKN